jgi:hypothetical protein
MAHPYRERTTDELPMEPGDSMVAGPGVVATKSQTKGSIIWALVGAVIGAVIGLLVGLLIGGGSAVIIAMLCFAAAGVVGGGTVGGFVRPKHDTPMEGGSGGIR